MLKRTVRCCIYLTTYDWIKSFLIITIDTELYWTVKYSIHKNNDAVTKRCRRKITEGQWAVLNFV
jgi:hypothetical protein